MTNRVEKAEITHAEIIEAAAITTSRLMQLAVLSIDDQFEEDGYAAAHPQLLAAVINASVMSASLMQLGATLEANASTIACAIAEAGQLISGTDES